jgi:lipid-A-disaccharide synthase-like uncharacterized protein
MKCAVVAFEAVKNKLLNEVKWKNINIKLYGLLLGYCGQMYFSKKHKRNTQYICIERQV